MRAGVDRLTMMPLTGWAHCRQSIGVIMSTAAGSLLMARDFGVDDDPVDKPMSGPSIARAISTFAEAIRREEPGFRLTKLAPTRTGADGVIAFDVAGDFYPNALEGDFTTVERNVRAAIALPFAQATVQP